LQIDIEHDDEAAGLGDRGHLAQRVHRARQVAQHEPAVNDVERIARQTGLIDARLRHADVAMAGFIRPCPRDGELLGAEVDAGHGAVLAHLFGEPAQRRAGAAAEIGDMSAARNADG
jgi:hypothetical protein